MSEILTTLEGLGEALAENKIVAFSEGAKLVPVAGRKIFKVINTDRKNTSSDSFIMDGFADPTGEGENYELAESLKGFALDMVQAKYAKAFRLSKEAGMYDQYSVTDALQGVSQLGRMNMNAIELLTQLFIGFGEAGSFTNSKGETVVVQSADGVNLFSNSHTNRVGSTIDNLDTTAFGKTGLQVHENLFRSFLNHAGLQTDSKPRAIYCTRDAALNNTIDEYLVATGNAFGVSSTNVYGMDGGRYEKIVMEYLDADADGGIDTARKSDWGLVDTGNDNLRLEVSQNPMVYQPDLIIGNRDVQISSDCHFAVGVRDATCITKSTV